MDHHEFVDDSHWSQTFRAHVLGLEYFLARRLSHDKRRALGRFSVEETVYLAGMIARETDHNYLQQIQEYLVADPEEISAVVRRHAPYLGQNAPVVTLSRINAEHMTLQIASGAFGTATGFLQLTVPARYFGIASFYSGQAGNQNLARIFDFFRNHLSVVVEVVAEYIEYLEANQGNQSKAQIQM